VLAMGGGRLAEAGTTVAIGRRALFLVKSVFAWRVETELGEFFGGLHRILTVHSFWSIDSGGV